MNTVRSALFALVLAVITPPYALIASLTFPFKPHTRYRLITTWSDITLWFVGNLLGIRYQVLGRDNMPQRASVILSKHQSAWETIALQHIFPPLAFVLKRELLKVPFFGWGLAQMPIVSIDRAAGKDALVQVEEQGRALLEQGFWVVVFPEGTRVAPGAKRRYKIGGAYLATRTEVPVVPVAHNAGEFWRRNALVKRPGKVTVSIGPPIDPRGLTPEQVNAKAQAWIEAEMHRLFPHHYPATTGA